MNKLFTTVCGLALAVAATPAVAQKTGSVNRNAPEVKQTIQMGDNSLTLNYTAITWAEGSTMAKAKDDEKVREYINNKAESAPLGMVKNTMAVEVAGKTIPVGSHDLFFTIHESGSWLLNLRSQADKTKKMTWRLALQSNEEMPHDRLVMSLFCSGNAGAGIYLGFGPQMMMINVKPAKNENGAAEAGMDKAKGAMDEAKDKAEEAMDEAKDKAKDALKKGAKKAGLKNGDN